MVISSLKAFSLMFIIMFLAYCRCWFVSLISEVCSGSLLRSTNTRFSHHQSVIKSKGSPGPKLLHRPDSQELQLNFIALELHFRHIISHSPAFFNEDTPYEVISWFIYVHLMVLFINMRCFSEIIVTFLLQRKCMLRLIFTSLKQQATNYKIFLQKNILKILLIEIKLK